MNKDDDAKSNMKPTDVLKSDINILLLGVTGVGKSTFINSFANYIQYQDIETATKSKLLCLIPSKVSITDINFKEHNITVGDDKNEDKEFGNSSTQGTRAYVFPIQGQDVKIRLIDTPGIGDSRGLDQDKENFENILSYISRFPELHAICFLLRPDVSVINAYFEFCINHLLSRLDKSAAKNIIFVFTSTRCSFYRPAETRTSLGKVLADVEKKSQGVKIPYGKENMFCFDNESFKYLVGKKNGITFGDCEQREFTKSWQTSVDSLWNMLSYISGDMNRKGLTPHSTEKTLSVNETRKLIIDLSKPLADIADLIQDNLTVLNRHQKILLDSELTNDELTKKLYIPCVNLKQKSLNQPVTVCTSVKCSETCTVYGITKYHYKTRCHNPCYLTNVTAEIIGAPELMQCAAMAGTQTCTVCKCSYLAHQHINYETELISDKIEDKSVKKTITTTDDRIKALYKIIQDLKKRSTEFEEERDAIILAMAKFAHYLMNNSITIYNDSYITYIDYLIDRENKLGSHKDAEIIKRYVYLKRRHEMEKKILESAKKDALKIDPNVCMVNSTDVYKCIQNLYDLRHTGKKIKDLHKHQENERKKEMEHNMEYCHPKNIKKPKNKTKQQELENLQKKLRNLNLDGAGIKELFGLIKQENQKPFSQHMKYEAPRNQGNNPRNNNPGNFKPRNNHPGNFHPRNYSPGNFNPRNNSPGNFNPRHISPENYNIYHGMQGNHPYNHNPMNSNPANFHPQTNNPGNFNPYNNSQGNFNPYNISPGNLNSYNNNPGNLNPYNNYPGNFDSINNYPQNFNPNNSNPGNYHPLPGNSKVYNNKTNKMENNLSKNEKSGGSIQQKGRSHQANIPSLLSLPVNNPRGAVPKAKTGKINKKSQNSHKKASNSKQNNKESDDSDDDLKFMKKFLEDQRSGDGKKKKIVLQIEEY
ncbi:PREDICTED: uncharacterized protein LOC108559146 [Nicrophorus vespilloides]|uniref:Uncharacterized protein LOC108559146 n=1 Tax=Nicrophorus vespilloides TaxID=110193 RepID=A0ABM1MB41_NICVS|nr:PREDICTED: uncharacterized protein LOC108559146 [Nicrophorus vespilloides]